MRLKVIRAAGGGAFTGVSTGPTQTIGTNASPTTHVFEARQPIAAGDQIAIDLDGDIFSNNFVIIPSSSPPGTVQGGWTPSLLDGQTRSPDSGSANELMFNADVEPEADGDGFGDETQDQCPTDASTQGQCPPPEPGDTTAPDTTITKGPKDKTRKKTATFTFTGTDARAVASFQCKLDAGAFAPCTSPHTVKVKKGKHTFQVQAIDEAGNVGAPATDDWKVKKKRKR
jgi:hypothetical protein